MTVPTGVDLIADERARQMGEEGWTAEHDDEHTSGELGRAAQAYLFAVEQPVYWSAASGNVPVAWPWHSEWWKPSDDPIRNLVKAGALIAAEIDRLQRQGGEGGDRG